MGANIKKLVESNSGKSEILGCLKENLHEFFGRGTKGLSNDGCILFRDFPVVGEVVDVAIMTGFYNMEIVLFEICGADFECHDSNGFPNGVILDAVGSLRRRIGNIYDHYGWFGQHVRDVKKRFDAGEYIHGAILSENPSLTIREDRPFLVSGVVIGGRCVGAGGAAARHLEFGNVTPYISGSSWDDWICDEN